MSDVVIVGIGQTPVGEHWDLSLRNLAARAMLAAIKDAGELKPQAVYIGNFLASSLLGQANLGALLTENAGLSGAEGITLEAAGASGAAAFRMAHLAVASGVVDVALALGVEKCTDVTPAELETAAAQALDYDYEEMQGLTLTSQAALLMQRYLYENDLPRTALAGFPVLAHANAAANPNAMFRRAVSREQVERAGMLSDPLNQFDMAPYADGAAALLITRAELVPASLPHPLVRVLGSSCVIDAVSLHDRPDPLAFEAARLSVERACRKAGILPGDVDLFELHDAFSIYAALSLEAAGFAPRGQGWKLVEDGSLNLSGKLPVCTLGGLKARGNPPGASGAYQLVEAVQQLRGQAGASQVKNARLALVQSLGGAATTAVTHVLERWQPADRVYDHPN